MRRGSKRELVLSLINGERTIHDLMDESKCSRNYIYKIAQNAGVSHRIVRHKVGVTFTINLKDNPHVAEWLRSQATVDVSPEMIAAGIMVDAYLEENGVGDQ